MSFLPDATGFGIKTGNVITHYKWKDIEAIFAYKEDIVTTDNICLDIFTNDGCCLKLSEETPYWRAFNDLLTEKLSEIPENWEMEIVVPAFETKLTMLYDKFGRSQELAEKGIYEKVHKHPTSNV